MPKLLPTIPKRSRFVGVRFTVREWENVAATAAAYGYTVSGHIRRRLGLSTMTRRDRK